MYKLIYFKTRDALLSLNHIEFRARTSNYVNNEICYAIIHPCPNPIGMLIKASIK